MILSGGKRLTKRKRKGKTEKLEDEGVYIVVHHVMEHMDDSECLCSQGMTRNASGTVGEMIWCDARLKLVSGI